MSVSSNFMVKAMASFICKIMATIVKGMEGLARPHEYPFRLKQGEGYIYLWEIKKTKRYLNAAPSLNRPTNPIMATFCTTGLINHSSGKHVPIPQAITDPEKWQAFTHPSQQHQQAPHLLRLHRQAQL